MRLKDLLTYKPLKLEIIIKREVDIEFIFSLYLLFGSVQHIEQTRQSSGSDSTDITEIHMLT